MAKAFRKTEKTKAPPNCDRFEKPKLADRGESQERLRKLVERLRRAYSGRGRDAA